MPSFSDIEMKYNSTYPDRFLIDLHRGEDTGPEELNLSEFIDAHLLQEHCKVCKLRRIERRQARKHKWQTFRRL